MAGDVSAAVRQHARFLGCRGFSNLSRDQRAMFRIVSANCRCARSQIARRCR